MVTSRMTLTVLSGTAENNQQVLGKPGRRLSGFPSRRTHHMEHSAGQCDLCSVSDDLPTASEIISVPGLILRHYHRSPLTRYISPPVVNPEDILLLGQL